MIPIKLEAILMFLSSLVFSNFFYYLISVNPYIFTQDIPNTRSSHSNSVPRGVGLVFVCFSILGSILSVFLGHSSFISLVPLFLVPLSLASLLDDFRSLSSLSRFFAHCFTSVVLVYYVFPSTVNIFFFLLLCLFVVFSINAFNFMDGINGLVAGCSLISISTALIYTSYSGYIWFLSGSLLCFLFWNWTPAKFFMGDVGSTFLGAFYASIILQSGDIKSAIGLILVGSPLYLDSLTCICRRFYAGHNIFSPHRCHLYQRLVIAGLSHSNVTLIYMVTTIILSFVYLCYGFPYLLVSAFLVLLLGFLLDKFLASPFLTTL